MLITHLKSAIGPDVRSSGRDRLERCRRHRIDCDCQFAGDRRFADTRKAAEHNQHDELHAARRKSALSPGIMPIITQEALWPIWALSLIAVGVLSASAQGDRLTPLPTFVSGNDIGFRIERTTDGIPIGRLVGPG